MSDKPPDESHGKNCRQRRGSDRVGRVSDTKHLAPPRSIRVFAPRDEVVDRGESLIARPAIALIFNSPARVESNVTVTKMTRFGAMAAALLAQAFLFGCSFNAYLDKQAPEIRAEDIRRPSNPSPVQLSVAVSGGAVQADAAAEARQIVATSPRF